MERSGVQKTAWWLRIFVVLTFILNVLVLPLVPGAAALLAEGGTRALAGFVRSLLMPDPRGENPVLRLLHCVMDIRRSPLAILWTGLFLLCGVCTAVILWQARMVLDTVLAGNPFQTANARCLRRAAGSCWVISGAALVRLVHWISFEGSLAPLFTWTFLFIPLFFMAGLLFMVMSALFRQAAELKEDQDLTI